MGLCGSAMHESMLPDEYKGNWTLESIQATIKKTGSMDALAQAEMQPGNVVKIIGNGGIFNPGPIMNESWLQGRMTNAEYQAFIHMVNDAALRSYIGKPKAQIRVSGQTQGEDNIVAAQKAALAAVNQAKQWWLDNRGVNITFQIHPKKHTQISRHSATVDYPTDLFFAILDRPAGVQPPMMGAAGYAPPPYYPPVPGPYAQPAYYPGQGPIQVQPAPMYPPSSAEGQTQTQAGTWSEPVQTSQ